MERRKVAQMFFITRSRTAQEYSCREVVSTNGAETRGEKTGNGDAGNLRRGELAGAEGFEPSPSSLTVRCPTSWTTPQQLHAPRPTSREKLNLSARSG